MDEKIKQLNDTVPGLPEFFPQWAQGYMPKIAIFYRRDKKGASCLCGKCNVGYHTEEIPVRRAAAVCPFCGNKGVYEWKKVTRTKTDDVFLAILQVTSDKKLVLRKFRKRQVIYQGAELYEKTVELQRSFFDLSGVVTISNNYRYYTQDRKWGMGWNREIDGISEMYPEYDEAIRQTELKYCDARLLCQMSYGALTGWRMKQVLTAFIANPALEMFAKAGMKDLVSALVQNDGKSRYIYRKGKTIQKQLRLKDRDLIKRLVAGKGNIKLLRILQYEQKIGTRWNVEQEEFAGKYMDELPVFLKYMSLQQLMNRVGKYINNGDYKSELMAVAHYRDYLKMREELEYDMTNEVYIHPKNLRKKHDELVRESNEKKDELRISKKNKQFNKIAQKYEKISKKYAYEEDMYFIRPAKSAGEIIAEGQFLHHCVGSSDTYMGRHNSGASYIMFLRKKSEPDTPYYTIEIKGNDLVQWYSMNDRKPDGDVIKAFLDRWTEYLKTQNKENETE